MAGKTKLEEAEGYIAHTKKSASPYRAKMYYPKELEKLIAEAKQSGREEVVHNIKTCEFLLGSKSYRKVREHRGTCPKWGKFGEKYCFDCFGGGLNKFTEDFLEELMQGGLY